MMIRVGKIIYSQINDVVKTYPIVAENTTKYPFCVYQTEAQRPSTTKDGIYEWVYEVKLNIVDTQYDNLLDLTDSVIDKIMELEKDFDINIESITEYFSEDAFVKELNIIIKI